MQTKKITLVVPVYNEMDNLYHFVRVVEDILQQEKYIYTLLFVDSASTDGSSRVLHTLCLDDSHVRLLSLPQHRTLKDALWQGLLRADGDAVVTLAADLQDPPRLLPQFLQLWQAGWQVVLGKRENTSPFPSHRRDTFMLLDHSVLTVLKRNKGQFPDHIALRQITLPFQAPARQAAQTATPLREKISHFFHKSLASHQALKYV